MVTMMRVGPDCACAQSVFSSAETARATGKGRAGHWRSAEVGVLTMVTSMRAGSRLLSSLRFQASPSVLRLLDPIPFQCVSFESKFSGSSCVYACMCMCVCVYAYARMCICTYVRMHARMY